MNLDLLKPRKNIFNKNKPNNPKAKHKNVITFNKTIPGEGRWRPNLAGLYSLVLKRFDDLKLFLLIYSMISFWILDSFGAPSTLCFLGRPFEKPSSSDTSSRPAEPGRWSAGLKHPTSEKKQNVVAKAPASRIIGCGSKRKKNLRKPPVLVDFSFSLWGLSGTR